MAWFRRWLLVVGCFGVAAGAGAQPAAPGPPPVPVHALRNLSSADTTLAELEFLRAEIGGARVVFLGEPTHGEGNVLAAKARLVAFLQQRMGFTTLAMESGFFELHKAQQGIAAGKSVAKNLESSVFPVWTSTQEFRAVVPLVGPDGLRIMGFDPQLSGDYSDDLADDLEDFLEPEKGADAVDYELLGDVLDYMAAHYAVPPAPKPAEFEAVLAQADRLLRKAAGAPTASRRAEAAFWQQCLRSLGALARDYAAHDPSAKTAATFVAADSNPRDAQMADNLLWYLRQHPAEKVICWGALPHFANHVEVLGSEELRAYQPMGRAVKAALGPNQVYVLGTLAGGGTHGPVGTEGVPVPPPAPGTLEADLLARAPGPFAFVSLKHDAPGLQLTTYAFDYQPLAGPWSEVVDGFFFFRSVEPPHVAAPDSAAGAPAAATVADTAAAAVAARTTPPGSRNPAASRGGALVRAAAAAPDVSGVRTVRGQVLDARSRAGVPYASVVVPGQGKGTTANAQGRFALSLPGPTALQISSLGYATATVQSPRGNEELTVPLVPAAYALDEVRVPTVPPSPVEIMKRVIKAAPTNYEQRDYATEVYAHRRISNFDTLRYEVETLSRMRVPAGYRHFGGGFMMRGPLVDLQVQQQHVLVKRGAPVGWELYGSVQNSYPGPADAVRISPLFVARNLRKFNLKLDSVRGQGSETVYVLSFAAKRANHRSTGTYLMSGYQGRLLVQQRDYAVVHYEALWQRDTATYNAVARKNFGRNNLEARLYTQVYTADRGTHVVDYAKGLSGRYYARRSVGVTQSAGHVLGKAPFYYQSLSELFFKPLPDVGPPPAPAAKTKGPPVAPPEVPYRPEFWVAYPRPGGALAAPATQP